MKETRSVETFNRNREKQLAVIIPAMDEADKIDDVLHEVKRLMPNYIVVVVNGSTDNTAEIARAHGAIVIEYKEPLGNDVGRAIGAMQVEASTYLFIDADIIIPAEDLIHFVTDVENGTDMALNAIDWVARHPRPHAPAIDRYFINIIQHRRDLGLENVLTVPHAFSKRALKLIGKETLANPQLATAVTINKGLNIKNSNDINVLKMNKKRSNHRRKKGEIMSQAYQRMHGDTVEACYYLLEEFGKRAGYSEGNRRREVYQEYKNKRKENTIKTYDTSIILSISDYSVYLSHLIKAIVKLDYEVIPIVHGKSKKIRNDLRRHGLHYIDISEYIGHDTAFAIGAEIANGENLIFHDTAIPIDPYELKPFINKLRKGEADLVINNQNTIDDNEEDDVEYVGKLESMHPVHIGSYFMNITLGRNDLTVSSMLLTPYGMSRHALETIGSSCLLNPCLAQIRAVQSNLVIAAVGEIDIIGRINETAVPVVLNNDRVLGDFMEGLYDWTAKYGPRGGFFDGGRNRTVLRESKGYYKLNPFARDSSKIEAAGQSIQRFEKEPEIELEEKVETKKEQLQQSLGQIFIEQLELAKEVYPPSEYEQMLQEHLYEELPLHEYYIIAKMLLTHYEATKQHKRFALLLDELTKKYAAYPVLMEELKFLKTNKNG